MCSVIGLQDSRDSNLTRDLCRMLDATSHRGPDGVAVANVQQHVSAARVADLREDLEGSWGMGHRRLAITGTLGLQPLRDCQRRFVAAINGELWYHQAIRRRLAGAHRMDQDSDCDILPHLIEAQLGPEGTSGLARAVDAAVRELDGEYAVAVMDGTRIVLARDPIGIKPLYYGRRGGRIAFASEEKALWAVGLEAEAVPPDATVELTASETRILPRGTWATDPVPFPDRESAYAAYAQALDSAVRKRIQGHTRIGVVFSGGVDSVLVAAAVQRLGVQPVCFVAGAPDAPDVQAARRAAQAMRLPLHVLPIDVPTVRSVLRELLVAVEDRNQLHVETAVPLFLVAREARRQGLRVLLTGQGADELFAGYAWYPHVLAAEGETGLRRRLEQDRTLLAREALEREDKVSMAHSVELRVPFLDPEVVRASRRTPISAMLEGPADALGKRVHRSLAEAWGVPRDIAWRLKEAAQHGSNTRNVLLEAVRDLSPRAPPAAYDPEASLSGPVGSSQRYGHRYLPGQSRWRPDSALQWALDRMAVSEGTIGATTARNLAAYLDRLLDSGAPAKPQAQG